MAKGSRSTRGPRPKVGGKTALPSAGSFVARDLCAVNPLAQQFEPTAASPIRQHKRMAGMG